MIIMPYDRYLAGQKLKIRINNINIPIQDASDDIIDKMIKSLRKRENIAYYRISGDVEYDRSWIQVLLAIKKERRKLKLQKICSSQEIE